MRDLAVLAVVVACAWLAFLRPWVGVIAMAAFAYMHPQAFAPGFMHAFPAYKVLFFATLAGVAFTREWRLPMLDWRVVALLGLWFWFFVTSWFAKADWAAWPRLEELSKIFLTVGLTAALIDSRRKLHLLIVVTALSFALLTIKGGYWAVTTGFSNRVYGPPDSQYYDNNMFAIATIMNVPLLLLWRTETRSAFIRHALSAAVVLSIAAALSSWSRGALITLAATLLFLLFHVRRWYLVILFVTIGAAIAYGVLPDAWIERMHSLTSYQTDASAQSRLDAWAVGLQHAIRFPLTGLGFDGWRYAVVTMDWHSSYVEMVAEHGFVGLALWCMLLFGTIASLLVLRWHAGTDPHMAWVKNHASMVAASLVAYAAGSAFLGLSYWDFFYQLVIVAVLLTQMSRSAVTERVLDESIFRRGCAAGEVA